MGTKAQKIGMGVALGLVVIYLGYLVYRAGGVEEFVQDITQSTSTPAGTAGGATATPRPGATRTPTPQPVVFAGAAAEVLASVNSRRADTGAGILGGNAILKREAQEHADDMVARGYFSHVDPEGVTFQQRMSGSGYQSGNVSENIGVTSGNSATEVVGIWMNSATHRENMLDPKHKAIGVGVAEGKYQGQPAVFVVLIFGDLR